jgi:hypothetical protein
MHGAWVFDGYVVSFRTYGGGQWRIRDDTMSGLDDMPIYSRGSGSLYIGFFSVLLL